MIVKKRPLEKGPCAAFSTGFIGYQIDSDPFHV